MLRCVGGSFDVGRDGTERGWHTPPSKVTRPIRASVSSTVVTASCARDSSDTSFYPREVKPELCFPISRRVADGGL